jgi:hypothetical protein
VNNSQEQAASTLPDPQTAYNNLFAGIHQRVFFQKCAAAGYQPNDQRQAQEEALAIKQAASEWAGDPTFYNSVLALKSAEAAQIQAEIENWRRQQAG